MSDNNEAGNKRIAKNSVFLTIRLVVILGITLYTTSVVLDALGVVDYGIYNVVCGFVAMFSFLNTSMTNAIQRFFNYEIGKQESSITSVYNTALRIQLLLALIIIVAIETGGLWYLYHKMNIPPERFHAAFVVFQCALISLFFLIIQVPYSAIIIARERMDYYALVGILDAVLKLCIAFAVARYGADRLIFYGVLSSGITLLNFLFFLSYAKWHFPELRLRRSMNRQLFVSMTSFSGWNLFGSFSGVVKEQGIDLVLNLFFGPIVNAARGIANQINGGLKSMAFNLSIAIRPQVIQSYAAGNIDRTMQLTYSISRLSCGVLYLMELPILLECDFLLHIWLRGNVPEHTATFVFIIAAISFIDCLNAAVSGVIHASGRMKVYQTVSSTISLMCIPSAYLLMQWGFDAEWALVMVLLFASLSHTVSLFILRGIVPYSIMGYVREIVLPFLTLVLLTFWLPTGIRLLMEPGWWRTICVGICTVLFVSLMAYPILLSTQERNLLKEFLHKKTCKSQTLP